MKERLHTRTTLVRSQETVEDEKGTHISDDLCDRQPAERSRLDSLIQCRYHLTAFQQPFDNVQKTPSEIKRQAQAQPQTCVELREERWGAELTRRPLCDPSRSVLAD